jgi:hypothetical protein
MLGRLATAVNRLPPPNSQAELSRPHGLAPKAAAPSFRQSLQTANADTPMDHHPENAASADIAEIAQQLAALAAIARELAQKPVFADEQQFGGIESEAMEPDAARLS